jgi:hypothetical protein
LVGTLGIHIRLEAKFIKSALQAFMQRYRLGTKRHYLSILDYLEVEILAREVVMIVLLLVGILQPINILCTTGKIISQSERIS